ncbi:leucine-rich repeat protein [Treponema primitia]|uniref:leucine-rich repeat protein n=1 Tax=Treponema primitia TaxID=88058 RepID=UPI0002DAF106|nr:leucine-rich repeat protein [Treponema primitia]
MKRMYFVFVLWLSVFLLVLESCDNPASPAIGNGPANQEIPEEKEPSGKTSDPDDSTDVEDLKDPDDSADHQDPEDPDDQADIGDPEDPDDSADIRDPEDLDDSADIGDPEDLDDSADIEDPEDPDDSADGDGTDDPEAEFPEGEGANGTLSYTVEFPGDKVRSALMTLSRLDNAGQYQPRRILDLRENYIDAASAGSLTLPPGCYQLELSLNSLYPKVVKTEILYIYPETETIAPVYHFDTTEFSSPIELTGTKELQDYLAKQQINTEANPYIITVGGIDLSSSKTKATENNLIDLYTVLNRYAALDLSDCFGKLFYKFTLAKAPNKAKIRALILPSELKTIPVNAFVDCAALVSVDMPGVTTVSHGAFDGCAKLEAVYLDNVERIENEGGSTVGAFNNCTALTSVFLPRAVKVEKKSFNSCTSLSIVYLPQAAIIGDKAFADCTSLECLILGETPPELGKSVFAGTNPGIIYVPSSAIDTYQNTVTTGWTDVLKAKVRALP